MIKNHRRNEYFHVLMCMWNVVFVASKDILKDKVLNALKLDISIY